MTVPARCAGQEHRRRRLRRRSPPALRIALRATALRAALDPGDHCGPWNQEEQAGPGLPPRCARRANPCNGGPICKLWRRQQCGDVLNDAGHLFARIEPEGRGHRPFIRLFAELRREADMAVMSGRQPQVMGH